VKTATTLPREEERHAVRVFLALVAARNPKRSYAYATPSPSPFGSIRSGTPCGACPCCSGSTSGGCSGLKAGYKGGDRSESRRCGAHRSYSGRNHQVRRKDFPFQSILPLGPPTLYPSLHPFCAIPCACACESSRNFPSPAAPQPQHTVKQSLRGGPRMFSIRA